MALKYLDPGRAAVPTHSAERVNVIVPHDTNDLPFLTRGIYIGGDGDLAVETADGDDIVFVGVKQGSIIPVSAMKVLDTGTTATNLLAMF